MGRLAKKQLWTFFTPRTPGQAVPVGRKDAAVEATATVIRKIDGLWHYDSLATEINIEIWPNRFLEVEWREGHLIWMGLEVTTSDRSWHRAQLSFALEPYSLNWYGHSPLRKAAKNNKTYLAKALRPLSRKEQLLPRLQRLAFDPFATNRQSLTARLDNPMRLHWDGLEPVGAQFAYGRSVNYTHGKPPSWLFGVCAEYELAVEELQREVQLLPRSDKDEARFGAAEHYDAALLAAVKQALGGYPGCAQPRRVAYNAQKILHGHLENAGKRKGEIAR